MPLRPSAKRVTSAEPSNRVLWVYRNFYDVLSKLSIKRIAGTKFYLFSSSFTFLLLVLQLLIDLESNPNFALTSYEAIKHKCFNLLRLNNLSIARHWVEALSVFKSFPDHVNKLQERNCGAKGTANSYNT